MGDITKDVDTIQKACSWFLLQCYHLPECLDLNEARVRSWEKKMARNVLEPPKLKSLPPTEVSFRQNVLRAHLAAATMTGSLNPDPPQLITTEFGWYLPEGFDILLPRVTPEGTKMAPDVLIKVIECQCKTYTPCRTKQCICRKHTLKCTFLCKCRSTDICNNTLNL